MKNKAGHIGDACKISPLNDKTDNRNNRKCDIYK